MTILTECFGDLLIKKSGTFLIPDFLLEVLNKNDKTQYN